MLDAMAMQISGKLHATFEAQQVTQRFRKREFVVELGDNPDYPQFVMFQLTGDRCEHIDGFKIGDEVNIEFNLRGREWNSPQGETKYFNSLDVWKIEKLGSNDGGSRGIDEPPPHDDEFLKDVPF
jgi:hypothetical protein